MLYCIGTVLNQAKIIPLFLGLLGRRVVRLFTALVRDIPARLPLLLPLFLSAQHRSAPVEYWNNSSHGQNLRSTLGQAEPIAQYFVKGSLTRDFRSRFFFMNQCPPGPQVFHWGRFEFFRKCAEIFAN
jgi:hypothetical protein